MKRCAKCKIEKSIKDFHRAFYRNNNKWYYQSYCKGCRYQAQRVWNLKNIDIKREKGKIYVRKRRATIIGYKARESAIYRKKYPERCRAYRILIRALKNKKIKRLPCIVCGSIYKIHGHHEDYFKPLEVMWLCTIHHKEVHKNKKDAKEK